MDNFRLYELTEMYQNIWDLVGDDEVDLDSLEKALSSIEDNIEAKAENTAKLIKGIEGDISILKEEENRLAKKRRTLENKQKNIKKYLEMQFKVMEINKIKTPLFTVSLQKNPPSIEIINEDLIPEQFKNAVTTISVAKKDLLEAIKDGQTIEGAKIKQGESLRIR